MKNFPATYCGYCNHKSVGRERGASMVEFVVVAPVALLVILALIQIGMMMVAKQVLNEATFEAARMGASEHAQKSEVMTALKRKLLPFYQDSTNSSVSGRLFNAALAEEADVLNPLSGPVLSVNMLSPPSTAFQDFGINDGTHVAIPNDNLEFRLYSSGGSNDANNYRGPNSNLTIQDANEFRIKVVYSYQLKVPLMAMVFKGIYCGLPVGIQAFGLGTGSSLSSDCLNYYNNGRVPITSYATVQMQSDAWQDSSWN